MKLTEKQYKHNLNLEAGFCTHCEKFTETGVMLTELELECPECGNMTLYGIEQALDMVLIEVDDEIEEDDEDLDPENYIDDSGDDDGPNFF